MNLRVILVGLCLIAPPSTALALIRPGARVGLALRLRNGLPPKGLPSCFQTSP
jgi:hypothetical protein